MGSGRSRIYNIISIIFLLLSIIVVVWVVMRLIGG